ncbi:flavoprotein [Ruficoccus sp. ZRK36]|uniref:flavoprotein n=1 Tax=Ruficoccus sp. ZRK36 TaxID=2866311 RepID=UPI001C73BBFA|nr:flavoprotein [Ruficoccus sp. ZRK36]QYY34432.1 phosphopantothenoylcysteine decarboxylase [Ruficoccus sp. ZRK36]
MPLQGKTIVLGVTGSIAAYKAADIASQLTRLGASVHCVMTKEATHIIGPLTLQTLSRNPVGTDMWQQSKDWQPEHIELADSADLFLVAPATANIIACFAHGLAPDLLTSIYLATLAPVIIAPAMNGKMYRHPATQANMDTLRARGTQFIEPQKGGMLACGYEGEGKLSPVDEIVARVAAFFQKNH